MNFQRFLTRKNIILAFVGIIILIGVILGIRWLIAYLSERVVTFTLSQNVTSIVVTNNDAATSCSGSCPSLVNKTLSASGKLRLPDGQYSITPFGDNIVTDRIYITVSKDATSFSVDPYYSETYLSSLLESESAPLLASIVSAYPAILNQYNVGDGTLYRHGDWYISSLMPVGNGDSDVYSIILHKTNGAWSVATKPSLYYKYTDYPSIPKDILYQANIAYN